MEHDHVASLAQDALGIRVKFFRTDFGLSMSAGQDMRGAMTALEKRLNPKTFLRASRGAIVNLQKIKSLEAGFKNESYAILENDTRIPVTKPLREVENALRFS